MEFYRRARRRHWRGLQHRASAAGGSFSQDQDRPRLGDGALVARGGHSLERCHVVPRIACEQFAFAHRIDHGRGHDEFSAGARLSLQGRQLAQGQRSWRGTLDLTVIGFGLAAGLLLIAKVLVPAKELYQPPTSDRPPPWWIRALLIGTCTGVSFAHGSNDGQKGMGLIMLVLIGIVPTTYALNMNTSQSDIAATVQAAKELQQELESPELSRLMLALKDQHLATSRVQRLGRSESVAAASTVESLMVDSMLDPFPKNDAVLATLDPLPLVKALVASLEGRGNFKDLSADDRWQVRTQLVELGASVRTLVRQFGDQLAKDRSRVLTSLAGQLSKPVEYEPEWVVMGVALCLGLGTMVGWERIVKTVGEKIGKTHLTYAQGGAAELVAAVTIGMADSFGMPVSTTHVLASGVAGTIWANKSGIQAATVRDIALAWILTLPVAMALSSGLYWLCTFFVG